MFAATVLSQRRRDTLREKEKKSLCTTYVCFLEHSHAHALSTVVNCVSTQWLDARGRKKKKDWGERKITHTKKNVDSIFPPPHLRCSDILGLALTHWAIGLAVVGVADDEEEEGVHTRKYLDDLLGLFFRH